jgi:hypothetical protein
MTHEHEHINTDRFADSAGVAWAGRSFEPNSWAGDSGAADEALVASIHALASGQARAEDVLAAFATARVLIPLLANLGEAGEGAHGQTVDKSADLAIVTVETPDGQDALPVFSSVAAMSAWNPVARPVPVSAQKAALAAAQEGNTRIVLDAGNDTEFVFRRPAIAAIAQGFNWVHPVRDERVRAAFAEATAGIPEILSFELTDCDSLSRLAAAEVQLELTIKPALSRDELDEVMQNLAKALAASKHVAEYVDSLRVKLV